jgi:hypothetical protein
MEIFDRAASLHGHTEDIGEVRVFSESRGKGAWVMPIPCRNKTVHDVVDRLPCRVVLGHLQLSL